MWRMSSKLTRCVYGLLFVVMNVQHACRSDCVIAPQDRLLRELEHGNDEEAEAAADKLEHDAEEDAVKVGKLEQDVEDSNLPAAEKQKRDALLKHLSG